MTEQSHAVAPTLEYVNGVWVITAPEGASVQVNGDNPIAVHGKGEVRVYGDGAPVLVLHDRDTVVRGSGRTTICGKGATVVEATGDGRAGGDVYINSHCQTNVGGGGPVRVIGFSLVTLGTGPFCTVQADPDGGVVVKPIDRP